MDKDGLSAHVHTQSKALSVHLTLKRLHMEHYGPFGSICTLDVMMLSELLVTKSFVPHSHLG